MYIKRKEILNITVWYITTNIPGETTLLKNVLAERKTCGKIRA